MIKYNNSEFEIDGIKRGFRLGTATFKLLKEKTGIKSKEELAEKVTNGDEDATLSLFYCCALHWHHSNHIEIDFNEYNVGDWLDELGAERAKMITQELFNVRESKNEKAPETGQAEVLMSTNGTH